MYLDLLALVGSWKVDTLALRIRWRGSPSHSDRVTFTRLAVEHARRAGNDTAARSRGRRERELVGRHGYPRSAGLTPRDPVAALVRTGQDPISVATLHQVGQLAAALKVDSTPIQRALEGFTDRTALAEMAKKIRSASRGRAGDQLDTGIRTFLQELALWWWRVTGERPAKRAASISTEFVSFPHLAEAALADVSAGVGHSLAPSGSPWTILNGMAAPHGSDFLIFANFVRANAAISFHRCLHAAAQQAAYKETAPWKMMSWRQ